MFYIQYQSTVNGRWIRSRYSNECGNSGTDLQAIQSRVDYLNGRDSPIKFRVANAHGKAV